MELPHVLNQKPLILNDNLSNTEPVKVYRNKKVTLVTPELISSPVNFG